MALISVIRLLLIFAACALAAAVNKECTNSPTPLSSHTFRAELSNSKNQSWRQEVISQYYHLIHTEDETWAHLLPRKSLREQSEVEEWALMYRKLKNSVSDSDQPGFLKEVSLHNVRLDSSSAHWRAQETNLQYLLMLDGDNLVWSFRKTAGLETPGKPYGGWEDKNGELRGHFVGHYLSATAKMWASTHNTTVKEKMSAVVSALSDCQEKMGSGYLSAFPSEQFDRFEAVQYVWAPYYTIHKIMAGLLDQYTYANDTRALKMLVWMVDYFYKRVQNVIKKYTIDRHWMSLNEETGGMNDVLYNLFTVTKDVKHLLLAHLFDKPCFLGLLALQVDDLSNFHANTHIPVVIGAQMRYEVTGDPLYKTIGTYFMDIVISSHSYATGGTSAGEFWQDPKRLATTLETENEESCTTYNMLKVSRNLFRWTKEVAYADYYERALSNGVLSIQRGTDPGVMIYMLPLGRGVSKAVSYHGWGTQFDSFWCCYGTAIESFSKLGDSIYFEEQAQTPGIYVTQYISSSLDWKSGQMILTQTVDPVVSWDPFLRVKFKISSTSEGAAESTLNFRIPAWSDSGSATAELNGQKLKLPASGNFLSITKKWSSTEELSLKLPISLRIEAIKDDRSEYSSIHAILYGPYLLAGLTDGDWDIAAKTTTPLSDWIAPVPASYNSQLLTLSQRLSNTSFVVSATTTNGSSSITMQKNFPDPGTDPAVRSTFKLITSNDSALSDAIGKRVMLEPFNVPGSVIVAKGDNEALVVEQFGLGEAEGGCFFRLMAGIDGDPKTVSLESENRKGCYVFSGVKYSSGDKLVLRCGSRGGNPAESEELRKGSSFVLNEGIRKYDPMSFEAVGLKRGFLLFPLMSFTDETYTAYFNFQG